MQTLRQDISYALRQMRLSPVFTLTAMLTLALGIGATTAIFSLIHSVMLKSLPVVDPSSLYRVGDGNDCCIEGGPQTNWGMYPYQLYQRFQQAAPEFEQLAAFQAGGSQFSVRRSEIDRLAKPLRGEFVTGNYFATFGVQAFAGRALVPADDQRAALPAAMLSYRAWQQEYGADPKVVGATFMLDSHPFTVVGITPPGFYGETLRSDPPEIWIPLQQEPMLAGTNSLLSQTNAWLRVIGRLRPGATTDGLDARFTAIMRQWLVTDFVGEDLKEYLPQIKAMAPKQNIKVVPAGAGVLTMKEDYKDSLRILLHRLLPGAADRLRKYRQPADGSRDGPPGTNVGASCPWCFKKAPYSPVADGKHCAFLPGRIGRHGHRLSRGQGDRHAGLPQRALRSHRCQAFTAHSCFRLWPFAAHWSTLRHRTGMAYFAC